MEVKASVVLTVASFVVAACSTPGGASRFGAEELRLVAPGGAAPGVGSPSPFGPSSVSPTVGRQEEARRLELSLGLGGHFGGTYFVEPANVTDRDADAGLMSKLAFDFFPTEHFGVGMFVMNAWSSNDLDGDLTVTGVGPAVKGRFVAELSDTSRLLITPGLGISYNSFSSDVDTYSGLGIQFGVDIRARLQNGLDLFVEPGFFTQPSGGDSEIDVTFDPIGYLMVGVGVSF